MIVYRWIYIVRGKKIWSEHLWNVFIIFESLTVIDIFFFYIHRLKLKLFCQNVYYNKLQYKM